MGKTILVIDDDEGIVEVIQIVLEGEGYQVIASMDGDYQRYMQHSLPDLILLDVLLLGQNGRDICQHLKSEQRTAYIPVIMLSAHTETHKLANLSGADDYLEKPFDVDHLIDIVKRYLPGEQPLLVSEELPGQASG